MKLSDYPKVFHKACLENQNCTKCGGKCNSSFTTKDGKNFAHFAGTCTDRSCDECNKVIGTTTYITIGSTSYHTECLQQMSCYLCAMSVKPGDNLVSDIMGVRHQVCDPNPCPACDTPLSNHGLIWIGKKWHKECIPVCYICHDNHLFQLRLEADGRAKHSNCVLGTCFLCSKPLAQHAWEQLGEQKFHSECVNKCSCGNSSLNPLTFPTRFIILNEHTKLSVRMKRILLAFVLSNKKTRALSHDIVRLICTMMINLDLETRVCIPERYGVDFRDLCTPNRCIKTTSFCTLCFDPLAPCNIDTLGCHRHTCVMVRDFERIIRERCFRKVSSSELDLADSVRTYRMAEKFKREQKQMTFEQLVIYAANMSSILGIMIKDN